MRSNLTPDTIYYLDIDDEHIPYTVVRDDKSKRIRIKADIEKGFVLSLPNRARVNDALQFIQSQTEWIRRQWKRIEKKRQQFTQLSQPLLERSTIKYLGRDYQVVIDVGERHWPPVVIEDDVIVVRCVKAELAEGILERWYRRQAKAVISGAIELYKGHMGVNYESLSIKDQKTRWGSCSSKGNLNFSWRLILAPKYALDYVVVHELAHLREMNHSEKFWKIVGTYYSEYQKAERWLKENGVSLKI